MIASLRHANNEGGSCSLSSCAWVVRLRGGRAPQIQKADVDLQARRTIDQWRGHSCPLCPGLTTAPTVMGFSGLLFRERSNGGTPPTAHLPRYVTSNKDGDKWLPCVCAAAGWMFAVRGHYHQWRRAVIKNINTQKTLKTLKEARVGLQDHKYLMISFILYFSNCALLIIMKWSIEVNYFYYCILLL